MTKADGRVSVHPASVLFYETHFPRSAHAGLHARDQQQLTFLDCGRSPYLVFYERVKTTKVYIRDGSMVRDQLVLRASQLRSHIASDPVGLCRR